MKIDFPQIEYITHASVDKMTYSQREVFNLMNVCTHFINITFQNLIDRISREYNSTSIVNILQLVEKTIADEEQKCDETIILDDFVMNASITSQSLKKIVNSPSKKLIKVDKNVPANKVTCFDSKIMTWLSRRPGKTIAEKIAPKNVIPTKVTVFTTDTVENRHTMYLFDILYDYLYDKVFPNGEIKKCETCNCPEDKPCFVLYNQIKNILFLKNIIRNNGLNEVPKQKQLRQNNKLLSDKEYKQIWDAVRNIDYFELNCKDVWQNLEQRFYFITFLLICARLFSSEDIYVYDNNCTVCDNNGILVLKPDDEKDNTIRFHANDSNQDFSISLEKDSIILNVFEFKKKNEKLLIEEKVGDYSFDLSDILSEIDKIKDCEKQYNEENELLSDLKKKKEEKNLIVEDINVRKPLIFSLISSLEQIALGRK